MVLKDFPQYYPTLGINAALPPFIEEHKELRASIRSFVERELNPHIEQWEAEKWFPNEVFHKLAEHGFLGLKFDEAYGGQGGDHLHAAVLCEELSRTGSAGLAVGVCAHTDLAMPPINGFGTEDQKHRYLVPAIKAEKIGALAITEPGAGSDVANIQTFAEKVDGGWIVNGEKVFITDGVRADFYVAAVKTSAEGGHGGMSFLIIDQGEGVSATALSKLGWHCSDTGAIAFQDVFVPDENLLGEVNGGFKLIMENFQWERLVFSLGAIAGAQASLEIAIDATRLQGLASWTANAFHINKETIVQLTCDLQAATALTYDALRRHHLGHDCAVEVSMASLLSQRVALSTAKECTLLVGAAELMSRPTERSLHDAAVFRVAASDDRLVREICADALGL